MLPLRPRAGVAMLTVLGSIKLHLEQMGRGRGLCTPRTQAAWTQEAAWSFILRLSAPVLEEKHLVWRPTRAWRDPPLTSAP